METYLRKIPSALLSCLRTVRLQFLSFFFLNKVLESFLSFQTYASALLWSSSLLLLLFLYCSAHSGFFQDFMFYLPAASKGHREEESTHSHLSFRKGNTDGVPVVTVCLPSAGQPPSSLGITHSPLQYFQSSHLCVCKAALHHMLGFPRCLRM